MKKLIGLCAGALFAISPLMAVEKKVTVCTSYLISATAKMQCDGDFNGEATLVQLYKDGWKIATDIGGSQKFIIILEK